MISRTTPVRWLSLLFALFVFAAGCSSTSERTTGGRAASPTGSDAADEDVLLDEEGNPVPTDASGSPIPGSSRSRSRASVGSGPSGGGSDGGGGDGGGTGATGIGPGEIKIGINITKNLQSGIAAVGGEGGAEERPIVDAIVKHFNDAGGLAGRKIIPVFYEYDAASGNSWDSYAQAACARFIDDEKVFIAISGHVGQTDSFAACMAKGKRPLVQQNQWPYDGVYFEQWAPYFYQPSRMRPERWVPAFAAGLKDAGYFEPGHKLGVVRFTGPVFDRIQKMMESEFSKIGVSIEETATVNTPQSVSDFGAMNSQIGNAIVQMRRATVTHIVFNEYATQLPFFFLPQAESQGYRPRYGFTSVQLTQTLAVNAPRAQLNNAVGVSWLPGQDVSDENDPRNGQGGSHDRCKGIQQASGIEWHPLYWGTHCDNFFFIEAGLKAATEMSVGGFGQGVASLGTGYDSPYTWQTRLGAGRPDGASAVRLSTFEAGCECFRYTSGDRPAG